MSIFEGKGPEAGVENLKSKFWYTLKNNWLLWPLANGINFAVVPLKFQVLYFNFVSIFWNMFLSYAQNVYKPEGEKKPLPTVPPTPVKVLATEPAKKVETQKIEEHKKVDIAEAPKKIESPLSGTAKLEKSEIIIEEPKKTVDVKKTDKINETPKKA